MTTTELDDPSGQWTHRPRTRRRGRARGRDQERRDASAAELAINEVNAGIYAFDGARLFAALERITNDNVQGEYYLPDVLKVFRGEDHGVVAFEVDDPTVVLGVNTGSISPEAAPRPAPILERHMSEGVTIVDPELDHRRGVTLLAATPRSTDRLPAWFDARR